MRKALKGLELGEVLKTAGAGHGNIHTAHLDFQDPQISFIAKPYNEREVTFYTKIKDTPLAKMLPSYYGSYSDDGNSIPDWLLIKDLTSGMKSPCIADIKLGTRSYEVNASHSKKQKQIQNMIGTTTITHAVRFIDVRIRKNQQIKNCWDRKACRNLTIQQFQDVLQCFLQNQRVPQLISGIQTLQDLISQTYNQFPYMRLYSASILLIYDNVSEDSPLLISLIDFAHAYIDVQAEGGDPNNHEFDDNALFGLENLIQIGKNILASQENVPSN